VSFHGTLSWIEEMIGADGAGSSSGMGPVVGEREMELRGEEGSFAMKELRWNILMVDALSFTDFSSRAQTCVSRSSKIDQCSPGTACRGLSRVRAYRTSMN